MKLKLNELKGNGVSAVEGKRQNADRDRYHDRKKAGSDEGKIYISAAASTHGGGCGA